MPDGADGPQDADKALERLLKDGKHDVVNKLLHEEGALDMKSKVMMAVTDALAARLDKVEVKVSGSHCMLACTDACMLAAGYHISYCMHGSVRHLLQWSTWSTRLAIAACPLGGLTHAHIGCPALSFTLPASSMPVACAS